MTVAVGAAGVITAGAVGAWLWVGSAKDSGACQKQLLADKRVRSALGAEYRSDLSCPALGAAVKHVTMGTTPGKHTLQQARAMQNLLTAVDDTVGTGDRTVDPALAVPLAQALADYADDTDQILTSVNVDYIRADTSSTSPWQDRTGVHMSMSVDTVLHVVRAVSDSPEAYATVRDAATRQAAADLAATPVTAGKETLTLRAKLCGRVLGSLDGVAEKVTGSVGRTGARKWGGDVATRLSAHASAPPAYGQDPAGHLIDSWKQELKGVDAADALARLEAQSMDMSRIWGKALGADGGLQDSLAYGSRDNAASARSDALDTLR
ncbi:hypothetical protein [Streptomyces sp. MMG1121]|uniref:hypothetical protein n=1 Tax=Streptomyces sp. MMG1121 TaxID=1415544 RepID=UPI00131C8A20|nr:hypothetical protein [Streptomyces sp. MMG1121]